MIVNKRLQLTAIVLTGLVLCSSRASASGFGLNEFSARVMGMGGAFTAIADSPAATFFNPAGLATIDGLSIEVGGTMVTPGASFRGFAPGTSTEMTVNAVRNYFLLPNLHISYRIHDMVAAGFGLTTPYGLTMEWPNTVEVNGKTRGWWGRHIIQKIALQTIFLNPTVAVKVHPRITIGAGLTIIPAHVELMRAVTSSEFVADDVDFRMVGHDTGFAATGGVLVKVLPDLMNVGLTYRGGTSFTFAGKGAFTKDGSGANVPAGLRTRLKDGEGEAALNLPHVISFGLAVFPTKELNIGFNFDVITWSVYDKLEILFKDNPDLNTKQIKDWRNTVTIRIGAEYFIIPKLPIRAGFIFDQAPTPATTLGPELPDGDRYEFTVGTGYSFAGVYVDLAYQFVTTGDVKGADSAPLDGVYRADAHLVGLSLGYTFGI